MAKIKTPTTAINSKSGRKSVAKIQEIEKQREKDLEEAKKADEQIEIQQIVIDEIDDEPETTDVEPETMEYAAPMNEPAPSTPMDEKAVALSEFVNVYKSTCIGKTIVPIEIGEKINDCFNRYTGRKTTFNGCSACLAKQKRYMLNEARNNGFDV